MEVEGHLAVLSWNIVVVGPDWEHLFHEARVINLVTQVVVWLRLVPVVLRDVRMVEVGDHV